MTIPWSWLMHMANLNPSNRFLALVSMACRDRASGGLRREARADGSSPSDPIPDPAEPPKVTITSVSISSMPVVDFSVVDREGFPVTGIDAGQFHHRQAGSWSERRQQCLAELHKPGGTARCR
jgi:hypothetical protein